jgi:dTDP-6-deoxy-L-talose 4-dehydrogenase (NAD+)
MSAMEIAVTGASGFIGRYVLAELARQKVKVVAVTRDANHLSGFGIAGRVVEMDLAAPGADCFDRLGRPDVLIHLAWDGLPNYKSLHHFETELPRQFRFLKAMVEAGLPSLLVTGTCFEYGMQSGALSEDLLTHRQILLCRTPVSAAGILKTVKPFNLTWARLFICMAKASLDLALSKIKRSRFARRQDVQHVWRRAIA